MIHEYMLDVPEFFWFLLLLHALDSVEELREEREVLDDE